MTDKELQRKKEIAPRKEQIVNSVIAGLKIAYQLHEQLGDAGRSDFKLNQFGETALTMDLQAEAAVLTALRETNISMQIFSEEHGYISIGEYPEITVTADGLDGSIEYKEKYGESMYGTMVSVLEGKDPTYNDYLVCGIMIHSPTPQLLLAVKEEGCFVVDLHTGERHQTQKQQQQTFSKQSIIDLDINWLPYKELYDRNKDTFSNLQCVYLSSAARTALFVKGDIDVGLEWTRKGNLEQPSTYGFVTEMGGVMTTVDGVSIGSKPFQTFGQDKQIPLIVALSQEVAMQASQRLNLKSIQK